MAKLSRVSSGQRIAAIGIVSAAAFFLAPGTLVSGATADVRAARSGTVIVATVGETGTGAPLADAVVRLPELGRLVRTNWLGEATITGVPTGNHRIQVRHLGHAPADVQVLVRGDTIGPMFFLEPVSPTLDTVRVTALAVPSSLREFEGRRKTGIGRYLVESDLAKEKRRSLALVLSMKFPGVMAMPHPEYPGHYVLRSMRAPTSITAKGPCNVAIYLDGFRLADDLDAIDPSDLAGAEMYSIASAPAQYRVSANACHVLLLWSNWQP